MKRRRLLAEAAFVPLLGLILIGGCKAIESLGELGGQVGQATGVMTEEQAGSLGRVSKAVAKTFADITPEQEYYIGRAVAAVVLSQYRPYSDENANAYLNLLGRTLALFSNRPETFGGYHFLILDSPQINAFAAPGGFIFVTRGMLRCAASEDEVAAILAHEIGHVQEKHGLQAIRKSRITTALTSAALTAAKTLGPDALSEITSLFDDSIQDITGTLINSGYSRAFERQADEAAVEILSRLGYDPRALIRVLQIMSGKLDPKGLDFAKTHPDPKQRIKVAEKAIGDLPQFPPADRARRSRYEAALGNV
jgi:predicted Zn-dependent protease